MGDYSDREAGFVPLTHYTKQLAFAAGLEQDAAIAARTREIGKARTGFAVRYGR